jgi:ornithine decarboxylase
MSKFFFADTFINTLKNLRQLVSSFPRTSGSVAVHSTARIDTQWARWSQALPRVHPYYAVKCNPEPFLLQNLIKHGSNFDCASLREVSEVRNCSHSYDMAAPEILYAHPLKSDRDINTIGTHGIQTTVVDSLEECSKLENCNWKGSVFLRVAVDDTGSKMPFSSKFGAGNDEIATIASKSRIPITGVSFHVGSGCEDPLQYKRAIEFAAGPVFDILRRYKHKPTVVDIGGGFSSSPVTFSRTAWAIQDAIEHIPKNRTLIAEPGRFFAQPSQDLFVKVIAKKQGRDGKGFRYVIDESLYGQFSCIPFDHQKPGWIRVSQDNEARNTTDAILFGRTCDSLDVIATGPMEELEVGDWLYFPLMGAYTSATASEFNGFPKPELVHDVNNMLPSTLEAWSIVDEFYKSNPNVKFSNTLVPIV